MSSTNQGDDEEASLPPSKRPCLVRDSSEATRAKKNPSTISIPPGAIEPLVERLVLFGCGEVPQFKRTNNNKRSRTHNSSTSNDQLTGSGDEVETTNNDPQELFKKAVINGDIVAAFLLLHWHDVLKSTNAKATDDGSVNCHRPRDNGGDLVNTNDVSFVSIDVSKPHFNDCYHGYTPLHYAVKSGSVEMCHFLLEYGAIPTSGTPSSKMWSKGTTPLMIAAEHGNPDICKILLDSRTYRTGTDVLENIEKAKTYPHYSVSLKWSCQELIVDFCRNLTKDVEEGTFLIDGSVDQITVILNEYETSRREHEGGPAHVASLQTIFTFCMDIIKKKHICNIDAINDNQKNALLKAAQYGHVSIVQRLVSNGANPNFGSDGRTALWIAATANQEAMCRYLLTESIGFNKQRPRFDFVLKSAVKNKWEDICVILLNKFRVPPNNDALVEAVRNGYHEICKLLVYGGADVNSNSGLALRWAAKNAASNGHEDVVEYILNRPSLTFLSILRAYLIMLDCSPNESSPRIMLKLTDALKGRKQEFESLDDRIQEYYKDRGIWPISD